MRAYPDSAPLQNTERVAPVEGGFRGILSIAGDGRYETPIAPSVAAAQILLDTLKAEKFPKPKNDGISKAQAEAMQDALGALHDNQFALAA